MKKVTIPILYSKHHQKEEEMLSQHSHQFKTSLDIVEKREEVFLHTRNMVQTARVPVESQAIQRM